MDAGGVACISDYGLGLVLQKVFSSKYNAANVRWMAPELISPNNDWEQVDVDRKCADIYSLAMVIADVGLPSLCSKTWTAVSIFGP